jgi:hypothetical protein
MRDPTFIPSIQNCGRQNRHSADDLYNPANYCTELYLQRPHSRVRKSQSGDLSKLCSYSFLSSFQIAETSLGKMVDCARRYRDQALFRAAALCSTKPPVSSLIARTCRLGPSG